MYRVVRCRVGNRPAEPPIVELQVLHPSYLIYLQTAEFLAPAVVGNLRYSSGTNHLGYALGLRDRHVRPPQLGDHILGLSSHVPNYHTLS